MGADTRIWPVDAEPGRRETRGFYAIACDYCQCEIEACHGAHGDWMHTRTRSEFCDDGKTLATPVRVGE